jgi:3-methyl-2-oxobutanoate hydroxymethyltransferase
MNETPRQKMTAPRLARLKQEGRKIAMLTAYDYGMARMLDESGVDVLLVGDSLAMVVQGAENTLPVTLDEMIYHGRMVARAARRALVVVDMPFPENHLGPQHAVASAARIIKETGAQVVKLEGGADQANVIRAIVAAGIPVMGHVGLRPQSVHLMGGYRVERDRQKVLDDALSAELAGACAVVLECVPAVDAEHVSRQLRIPTFGIGAGAGCDGQVLVLNDLLGLTTGHVPTFVQPYAQLGTAIREAVDKWCADVRAGTFPDAEHSF